MYPISLSDCSSPRARAPPAASRSENSASCCTGVTTELPRRQARNPPTASDSSTDKITAPLALLGSDAKSTMDLSAPASRPAWNASPITTKSASPLTKTSVQMVELNRDFIYCLPNCLLRRSGLSRRYAANLDQENLD